MKSIDELNTESQRNGAEWPAYHIRQTPWEELYQLERLRQHAQWVTPERPLSSLLINHSNFDYWNRPRYILPAPEPERPVSWVSWYKDLFPLYASEPDSFDGNWMYGKRMWKTLFKLPWLLWYWSSGQMRKDQDAYDAKVNKMFPKIEFKQEIGLDINDN